MAQYIIVNETRTKGQKTVLNKLDSLFGKVFKEHSLINEINRILPKEQWESISVKDGINITSNYLGLDLNLQFSKPSRKEYQLNKIYFN